MGPIFYNYIFTTHVLRSLCRLHLWRSKIDGLVVLAKNHKNELYSHTPQCYNTRTRKWESRISRNSIQNISIYLSICHGTYSRVYYPIGIGVVYGRSIRFNLSCLSNIGPGPVQPVRRGTVLLSPRKMDFVIIMLIGRLELFTVLILFILLLEKLIILLRISIFCTFVSNLKSKAKYSHNMPTTDLEENKIKQAQPERETIQLRMKEKYVKTYLKMNV